MGLLAACGLQQRPLPCRSRRTGSRRRVDQTRRRSRSPAPAPRPEASGPCRDRGWSCRGRCRPSSSTISGRRHPRIAARDDDLADLADPSGVDGPAYLAKVLSKRRLKASITRPPTRSTSAAALSLLAMSRSIGFSQRTALPSSTAFSRKPTCVSVGVPITTASTSGRAMAAIGSVIASVPRASASGSTAAGKGSATATSLALGFAATLAAWILPMRRRRELLFQPSVFPRPSVRGRFAPGFGFGLSPRAG